MDPLKRDIRRMCKLWGITYDPKISDDFLKSFIKKVGWATKLYPDDLSDEFLIRFENNIDWFNCSYQIFLSDKLIEKHKEEVSWSALSLKDLSEEFIEKYKDYIDWREYCVTHSLEIEFIEKYEKYIDFDIIVSSGYGPVDNLSEEIIRKYIHKFNIENLLFELEFDPDIHPHISKEFIETLKTWQ